MQAARMEEASLRLGRPVTKQVVIMDMQGLSWFPDPRSIAIFREFLTISASYYPETLAVQFFINAPAIFMRMWIMIKGWLDPVTAAKMHILGSDFKETLLQHIAADQLPLEYGGSNSFDALRNPRDMEQTEAYFAQFESAVGLLSGRERTAHGSPTAKLSEAPSGDDWDPIFLGMLAIIAALFMSMAGKWFTGAVA